LTRIIGRPEPGAIERVTVDFRTSTVHVSEGRELTGSHAYPLDSADAFWAVAVAWLRVAWDTKQQWTYTWLGRPVIQLPEDLLRIQEAIYRVQPDVILETGVAHGGSLVFYASLCRAIGRGRVIGVELPRSPDADHREAIEAHELADYIELVTGDSVDPAVVEQVRTSIGDDPGQSVFLLLDSAHTKAHVLAELEAYGDLVTPGSYAIAQDGFIMQLAAGWRGPRTQPDWTWDNPMQAAAEWAEAHDDWLLEAPPFAFNEGVVDTFVTHTTGGWLRRR
jgi:cephalosporin hydroxylase